MKDHVATIARVLLKCVADASTEEGRYHYTAAEVGDCVDAASKSVFAVTAFGMSDNDRNAVKVALTKEFTA